MGEEIPFSFLPSNTDTCICSCILSSWENGIPLNELLALGGDLFASQDNTVAPLGTFIHGAKMNRSWKETVQTYNRAQYNCQGHRPYRLPATFTPELEEFGNGPGNIGGASPYLSLRALLRK